MESFRAIPGVASVSATTRLPLNEFALTTFFELYGIPSPEGGFVANFRRISPAYFETLKTKILEGREFAPTDLEGSMPVALVSRTMANRFWKGQSPLGKRIRRILPSDREWRTIIGVVDDLKDTSLTAPSGLTFYVPYYQGSFSAFHIVIRSNIAPSEIVPILRDRVREIDPDLSLYQVATAEDLFVNSISRPRFAAYLLGFFGVQGLLIALLGVYGVISYSTTRRTGEIGIRMAIGARQKSILALVLQQSARMSLWGILIGFVLSLLVERLVTSLWHETGGVTIYLSTAFLLGLTATLASLLPALRATQVDPSIALRYE
jgi:putative ABC transport system permease protein